MKQRLMPWLALALPILAWGLSFASIKAALVEIPPMTLALGRFVLAGLVLGIWLVGQQRNTPTPRFTRRTRRYLVLSVLTGITLYFLCENHGVKLIPATAASLIIAGIPILALLAERMVSGTKLGLVGIVSCLVSFGGVGLLVGAPATSQGLGELWGYVLMLGASVAWVLYIFAMKPLQEDLSNLKVTFWQMVIGALTLIPFALAEYHEWRWPSLAGWGNLAFQGVVCSAASFLAYNYALEKLGRSTSSLALNLIPLVTAAGAWVFLGEVLNLWQWVGGVLVMASVLLVGLHQARVGIREAPF